MADLSVESVNLPQAHAGHWLAGVLYLVPVIVLAAAIGWQRLKERRGGSGGAGLDNE